MPPEQASGNANQVRGVADVYSVGAMGIAFHPNGRQLTSVGYGYRDGDSWGPGAMRVWNIPPIDPNKTVESKPE
jgi:hypothetical protein